VSLCLYVFIHIHRMYIHTCIQDVHLYMHTGCTFIHAYRMYIHTYIQDVHSHIHTGCTFTHTYRIYIYTCIQDVHSHIHTGFTFIHAYRMRNSSQYIYTCIQDEKHLHTPMAALGQRYRHSPRETRAPVCLHVTSSYVICHIILCHMSYRHSPRETRAPVCLRIGCRADSTYIDIHRVLGVETRVCMSMYVSIGMYVYRVCMSIGYVCL
jgi:hypothetical protein